MTHASPSASVGLLNQAIVECLGAAPSVAEDFGIDLGFRERAKDVLWRTGGEAARVHIGGVERRQGVTAFCPERFQNDGCPNCFRNSLGPCRRPVQRGSHTHDRHGRRADMLKVGARVQSHWEFLLFGCGFRPLSLHESACAFGVNENAAVNCLQG